MRPTFVPVRRQGLRTVLVALLAALLLPGCFTSVRIPANAGVVTGADAGLVFGSIGVSSSAPTIQLSTLQFRPVVGYRTESIGEFIFHAPVGVPGHMLSPMFNTPVDFRDDAGAGTVFVARLAPGEYELVRAVIENSPMGGWALHLYAPDAGAVPFHVEAGKATYLGRFLSHLRVGRDADRVPKVQGAYFVVSDQLARDLELLRTRGEDVAPSSVLNLAPRFMQVENDALRSSRQ